MVKGLHHSLGMNDSSFARRLMSNAAGYCACLSVLHVYGLGPAARMSMFYREAYEDFEEADKKRHMLRLWLASPLGW